MADRINWTSTPEVIWAARPPCPYESCGSTKTPRYLDSIDQGDGSRLRKCQCVDCYGAYRLRVENDPNLLELE